MIRPRLIVRTSFTLASAAVLLAALVPLTGCGGTIHGNWHMIKATPNKDVFAIDNASFNGDGSYSAKSTIEGKTNDEVGTYTFNGFELTMRPQAGGQRKYSANIWVNELRITDAKDRGVTLRKTK